jgi:tripartite-type tricarboxylate transporter receptor subunit TctC
VILQIQRASNRATQSALEKTMKKFMGCLVLASAIATANAQTWPAKAVTVIVPFPPGGSTDTIARTIASYLSTKLGQPFVVENKAGATGTIGATQVKRAPADGYTIMVTSLGPLVIAPHLIKNIQYDPLQDFDTITVAVQAPNVLVVPAASPYKSVADILAYQKANPGKMTFASSGNGASDHLTAALFWQQTKTTGLHVPYKGGAPAINDLLGGQVDASFQNINAIIQHVKAGKLKALAITSAKRSPLLPEVPTFREAGIPNADVYSWQAVVAPKGLPPAVRSKLHATIAEALNDAQVKPKLADVGFEIVGNSPAEFAAFQQAEYTRWKNVIQTGNITAD